MATGSRHFSPGRSIWFTPGADHRRNIFIFLEASHEVESITGKNRCAESSQQRKGQASYAGKQGAGQMTLKRQFWKKPATIRQRVEKNNA
jgi:hypothetical protein